MSDLSSIVDEMCAWLDAAEPPSIPTLPTSAGRRGNDQAIDMTYVSHTSHSSHTENKVSLKKEIGTSGNAGNSAVGSRVTSSYAGDVGSVGNVGSEPKTLAGSTSLLFPQDLENVGSVGTDGRSCGASSLGLTRAAPQQSDWWTGAAMAEADRIAPPPPPPPPLPIAPEDVRAGVEREMRALSEGGREGPDALRDAVEITQAKIRNAPALAECQAHAGQCHACGEPLDGSRPEVAVLNPGGRALHMHGGECHAMHGRRRGALVDRIMAAAGYGAEERWKAA